MGLELRRRVEQVAKIRTNPRIGRLTIEQIEAMDEDAVDARVRELQVGLDPRNVVREEDAKEPARRISMKRIALACLEGYAPAEAFRKLRVRVSKGRLGTGFLAGPYNQYLTLDAVNTIKKVQSFIIPAAALVEDPEIIALLESIKRKTTTPGREGLEWWQLFDDTEKLPPYLGKRESARGSRVDLYYLLHAYRLALEGMRLRDVVAQSPARPRTIKSLNLTDAFHRFLSLEAKLALPDQSVIATLGAQTFAKRKRK